MPWIWSGTGAFRCNAPATTARVVAGRAAFNRALRDLLAEIGQIARDFAIAAILEALVEGCPPFAGLEMFHHHALRGAELVLKLLGAVQRIGRSFVLRIATTLNQCLAHDGVSCTRLRDFGQRIGRATALGDRVIGSLNEAPIDLRVLVHLCSDGGRKAFQTGLDGQYLARKPFAGILAGIAGHAKTAEYCGQHT